MEMKSALPIQQHLLLLLLLVVVALICARVDAAAAAASAELLHSLSENELAVAETQSSARKHHKHHLLLFLGGLKSVAAVILIKIKIVLVVAAIVAVSMFTVKYLMGATALPYLHNKANFAQLPPPPSPQYLPVVHEPVYGHEYSSSVPWDHSSHEIYHGNEWSKVGNGARSLLDFTNHLDLEKISSKNVFNLKRKKMRRRR